MVSFIADGGAANKPILTKGTFETIARNHRILFFFYEPIRSIVLSFIGICLNQMLLKSLEKCSYTAQYGCVSLKMMKPYFYFVV